MKYYNIRLAEKKYSESVKRNLNSTNEIKISDNTHFKNSLSGEIGQEFLTNLKEKIESVIKNYQPSQASSVILELLWLNEKKVFESFKQIKIKL